MSKYQEGVVVGSQDDFLFRKQVGWNKPGWTAKAISRGVSHVASFHAFI